MRIRRFAKSLLWLHQGHLLTRHNIRACWTQSESNWKMFSTPLEMTDKEWTAWCEAMGIQDPEKGEEIMSTELTPPQAGFLGPKAEAEAEAFKIVEAGGIAWVEAEYGNDMGHENVYWGHRVYYFPAKEKS